MLGTEARNPTPLYHPSRGVNWTCLPFVSDKVFIFFNFVFYWANFPPQITVSFDFWRKGITKGLQSKGGFFFDAYRRCVCVCVSSNAVVYSVGAKGTRGNKQKCTLIHHGSHILLSDYQLSEQLVPTDVPAPLNKAAVYFQSLWKGRTYPSLCLFGIHHPSVSEMDLCFYLNLLHNVALIVLSTAYLSKNLKVSVIIWLKICINEDLWSLQSVLSNNRLQSGNTGHLS